MLVERAPGQYHVELWEQEGIAIPVLELLSAPFSSYRGSFRLSASQALPIGCPQMASSVLGIWGLFRPFGGCVHWMLLENRVSLRGGARGSSLM